jgi:hypothetical protein
MGRQSLERRGARTVSSVFRSLKKTQCVGRFLFAESGPYSVDASRGYLAITDAILTFGMRNSVKIHAARIEASPFTAIT